MTTDELIAHLKRERGVMVAVWPRLSGMSLSSEALRTKLAGYDQAIADAESAVVAHARGVCVLCSEETQPATGRGTP